MHSSTRQKGTLSEDIALEFLQNKGFSLIEKNFSARGGEIDLICKDSDFIVFVEVKSVKQNSGFSIYDRLSSIKKKRLRKAALNWLSKNNLQDSIWRFDFIGIVYGTDQSISALEYFDYIDL
jgi:putative endonuclease